jgi:hypothetical protein
MLVVYLQSSLVIQVTGKGGEGWELDQTEVASHCFTFKEVGMLH